MTGLIYLAIIYELNFVNNVILDTWHLCVIIYAFNIDFHQSSWLTMTTHIAYAH